MTSFDLRKVALQARYAELRLLAEVLKYDETQHPRDEHGRWTDSGGGAGKKHPGPHYSKDAWVDDQGVIHTDNVNDATRALYEGKHVELSQPKQASTLIDHLGKVSAHMIARGDKAPNFNLCNVSVTGTNLFCAESKGIPRIQMPQLLNDKQTADFVDWMHKKGYGVTQTTELTENLKATQDELNGAKVAGIAHAMQTTRPDLLERRIVVSRDNYILDGHHTWAARIGVDMQNGTLTSDNTQKITRVDDDIIDLMKKTDEFTGGAGHQGFGTFFRKTWSDAAREAAAEAKHRMGHKVHDVGDKVHEASEQGKQAVAWAKQAGPKETIRVMVDSKVAHSALSASISGLMGMAGYSDPIADDLIATQVENLSATLQVEAGRAHAMLTHTMVKLKALRAQALGKAEQDPVMACIDQVLAGLARWRDVKKTYPYSSRNVDEDAEMRGNTPDGGASYFRHGVSEIEDAEEGFGDIPVPGAHLKAKGRERVVKLQAKLAELKLITAVMKDFDESQHPRDEHGKFTWGSGPHIEAHGIHVYHGSRHVFDQFDDEKIGTGEGAQTFGSGLYVAENPDVAESYRQPQSKIDGKSPDDFLRDTPKIDSVYDAKRWLDEPQNLTDHVVTFGEAADFYDKSPIPSERRVAEALQTYGSQDNARLMLNEEDRPTFDRMLAGGRLKEDPGHIYDVAMTADPDKMLDWDAKLSEQPKAVRDLADKYFTSGTYIDTDRTPRYFDRNSKVYPEPNGAAIYQGMTRRIGGKEEASHALRYAGVPGIKYYDQLSRRTASGVRTRNYVVFDPKNLDVVTRKRLLQKRLAALRAMLNEWQPIELVKDFNPEQPRDSHGQWTSGGDPWNKATHERLESEYQSAKPALDKLADRVVDAGAESHENDSFPKSWDSMSAPMQDTTEAKWKEDNANSFYADEVNSWHENGDATRQAAEIAVDKGIESSWHQGELVTSGWAHDAFNDHLALDPSLRQDIPYTASQLDRAVKLSADEDGDLKVGWDKAALMEPRGYDPKQGTLPLPGVEPEDPSQRFTPDMQKELEASLKTRFEKERAWYEDHQSPPEYLHESAKESLDMVWDDKSDSEKYHFAKNKVFADENNKDTNVPVDRLPDHYDPLNENSDADYRRTQAVATYMSHERAVELLEEREIDGVSGDHQMLLDKVANADHTLWQGWKESSTGQEGLIIQKAVADELGGRFRLPGGNFALSEDAIVRDADTEFERVGGYDGVKALIRAKWETTQYLLDKSGDEDLNLYRGLRMYTQGVPVESVAGKYSADGHYSKLTGLKVQRNGAASFTTDPSIANDWGSDTNRVVLRASVPRTSVISVPAYGINIHSEREVVVGGLGWKGWDAWKTRAPKFEDMSLI